jgi:S1-C subfamily serine protease
MIAGCGGGDGGSAAGSPTVATDSQAVALERQYEKVVNSVLPSVVQINTDEGEGSGVVFDRAGHIVTNAHVVAGAREIEVTPASGGKPLRATLVGSFVADDLAVVKVGGGGLPPAAFGDSSQLKVGQIVLAMGNPLGLNGSVTNGIISATGRTVSTRREGAFPGATIAEAIQTSAAINPGNSGGALVTLSGQIIGVPTAAAGDAEQGGIATGIGFATPSNTVKNIVPQLIRYGKVTSSGRAALGVTVRSTIDLGDGRPSGVQVVTVGRGGPAERAGLKPGDVITAVHGTPTPSQSVLAKVLAPLKPGQVVKVEIESGGAKRTVNVTLGQLPGE